MSLTEKIVRKYLFWSTKKLLKYRLDLVESILEVMVRNENGTLTKGFYDASINEQKFVQSKIDLLEAIENNLKRQGYSLR